MLDSINDNIDIIQEINDTVESFINKIKTILPSLAEKFK